MSGASLDRWLNGQLTSLHTTLDDVLDLERGLADAMLPQAHADLVTALHDVLDLNAGLAPILLPLSKIASPKLELLVGAADELAGLTARERLTVRTWLPVHTLEVARDLIFRILAIRSAARWGHLRVRNERDRSATHDEADTLTHQLLRALVIAMNRTNSVSVGISLARRLTDGFLFAVHARSSCDDHEVFAFETALAKALYRILEAVTSMIGADLTSTDLNGVPLGGVHWSAETRWPQEWEDWVRENSVPVSDGVFEICAGNTGSRVPT